MKAEEARKLAQSDEVVQKLVKLVLVHVSDSAKAGLLSCYYYIDNGLEDAVRLELIKLGYTVRFKDDGLAISW